MRNPTATPKSIQRTLVTPRQWIPNRYILGGMILIAGVATGTYWLRTPDALIATDVPVTQTPNVLEAAVQLNPAKRSAAKLHMSAAELRDLQKLRRVPANIGYNPTHRLEVKMPVGGFVTRAVVQPGQLVRSGDELAILASVDVGLARDELIKAEADALLAKRESERAQAITASVDQLLDNLRSRPSVPDIEKSFNEKFLGTYRDTILSAYSRLLLAEQTARSADSLASDGAVSGRVVEERRSGREIAQATFSSVCEKSRFDASQEQARATAKLGNLQRIADVNRERLRLLLGPFAEVSSADNVGAICELVLRAPIEGRIEERLVTDGTPFVPSQTIFTITNTDTLWISAQIYERDWASLNENQAQQLAVESPAVPGQIVKARTVFVGVSVAADTRAIALTAEIANTDGRYKPGMFAWVSLPLGPPRHVLAVPASAVTVDDGRSFVFVEEEPGIYRRVDVTVGLTTPDFVEITQGLQPGQSVVDGGVFLLKSELLLQDESL